MQAKKRLVVLSTLILRHTPGNAKSLLQSYNGAKHNKINK